MAIILVIFLVCAREVMADTGAVNSVQNSPSQLSSSYWLDLQSVAQAQNPEQSSAVDQSGAGTAILGVPDTKDWAGLRRDTIYFVSYQLVSLGLLYMAPESVSNWTPEDKDSVGFDKWWNNVSDPQWDSDKWWINYVLHPYWGASYFVRARMRGYDSAESFWYSFALSSIYEFGVEAIFEEPSIQDIFITPALGSVLGSAFMNIREGIYAKQFTEEGIGGWDRVVLGVTDPLGWLNSQVDKLFGYDVQVNVTPYHGQLMRARSPVAGDWPDATGRLTDDDTYGLRFSLRF
ncbi:MAG: DUF3943 domain-containing protein [Gammaproteobacteria bacterium]|nr:DUF3943 domain-containing protein [Gammaproteobacteria bacterium]